MYGKAISSSRTGFTAKFDTRCIPHSGFGRFSQALLLPNWVAGFSGIVGFGILFFGRIGREETMMVETFGDRYREYRARTYRVIPLIF